MKRDEHVARMMNAAVAFLLIVCIAGCSLEGSVIRNKELTLKELVQNASPILEAHKGIVSQNLGLDFDLESMTGEQIVSKALGEDNGSEYLRFCCEISEYDNPDDVVEKARGLIGGDDFRELKSKAEEVQERIAARGEAASKGLPISQREPFLKDLKKLAVKSVVLLTAGIVYACVPTMMLWGKVTAAAAISIAAGALAVTVISVYEHYLLGRTASQSFQDWIKEVMTLPQAEYALAASMISTGTALNQGPVVSGLVVCVFAIYQAIDILRPMLETYNFHV